MRQDAERAAPPLMLAAELPADVTDALLEHDRRHADRHPPMPHYADFPDAEIRTTAISELTQDHVDTPGCELLNASGDGASAAGLHASTRVASPTSMQVNFDGVLVELRAYERFA